MCWHKVETFLTAGRLNLKIGLVPFPVYPDHLSLSYCLLLVLFLSLSCYISVAFLLFLVLLLLEFSFPFSCLFFSHSLLALFIFFKLWYFHWWSQFILNCPPIFPPTSHWLFPAICLFTSLWGKICVGTHTHARPEPEPCYCWPCVQGCEIIYCSTGTLPLVAPHSRVTFPPLLIALQLWWDLRSICLPVGFFSPYTDFSFQRTFLCKHTMLYWIF